MFIEIHIIGSTAVSTLRCKQWCRMQCHTYSWTRGCFAERKEGIIPYIYHHGPFPGYYMLISRFQQSTMSNATSYKFDLHWSWSKNVRAKYSHRQVISNLIENRARFVFFFTTNEFSQIIFLIVCDNLPGFATLFLVYKEGANQYQFLHMKGDKENCPFFATNNNSCVKLLLTGTNQFYYGKPSSFGGIYVFVWP